MLKNFYLSIIRHFFYILYIIIIFIYLGGKKMNESMMLLKEKFTKIKEQGFIKSTRRGATGIGKTFEDLIGKEEDHEEKPDFQGIEIKTKGDSKYNEYITLFTATPSGPHEYATHYLVDKYGYPDKILKNKKVLNRPLYSNQLSSGRYKFALKVEDKYRIIKLKILNNFLETLEENIYWRYFDLETKLYRKHRYLAIIKAEKKIIKGVSYYWYYDLKFYKIKNFYSFIQLIKEGKIRVLIRIGVYREGKRAGELHDRGTAFQIKEDNLLELFDEIDISDLG